MIALIAIKPIRGKTFILLFEQSPFSQTISFMILPITFSMKCILNTFLKFKWISLMCWLSAQLILHQIPANAIIWLWLWHRFKSMSLPSWNSSQLDVSGQRHSQVRTSHPALSDNGLTRIDGFVSSEKLKTWIPKNLIKILPRNDAHDLEGLNLAHFVMPIINTQKVVKCLVSWCLKTKSLSQIGIKKPKRLRNTKIEIL